MVHELGHCLALRHTNWAARAEANAIHIPGTPQVDNNSVMNGGTALNEWNGFSNGDITAIQVLYPECPDGFTFDGANCYSGIHFPPGYTGFIFGNGFYTEPNCNISTANNCCPPGFTFDGANCHRFGTYFDTNEWNAFIWNRTFYITPILRCD